MIFQIKNAQFGFDYITDDSSVDVDINKYNNARSVTIGGEDTANTTLLRNQTEFLSSNIATIHINQEIIVDDHKIMWTSFDVNTEQLVDELTYYVYTNTVNTHEPVSGNNVITYIDNLKHQLLVDNGFGEWTIITEIPVMRTMSWLGQNIQN